MENEVNISNISEDTGRGRILLKNKEAVLRGKYFLKSQNIGISISESDDLAELGYGLPHIKDAMIEVARYILAVGGKISYGGDMRVGGFTELMFDLLAYYKADHSLHPNERFFSYLAWPISLTLSKEKEAELANNITFIKTPIPAGVTVDKPSEFLPPKSPADYYIWAKCLTGMREEMEAACDARIFIGGRSTGFKGKCPGILEELLVAIEKQHPVFLIGAFGGITKDSIAALDGNRTAKFSTEYYFQDATYKEFFALYNRENTDDKIDYDAYFDKLKNLGCDGLSDLNGLSVEDNKRLAITPHISEIIYLILKGLSKKF